MLAKTLPTNGQLVYKKNLNGRQHQRRLTAKLKRSLSRSTLPGAYLRQKWKSQRAGLFVQLVMSTISKRRQNEASKRRQNGASILASFSISSETNLLIPELVKIEAKRTLLILHLRKIKAKQILFIPQIQNIEAERTLFIPQIGKIEAKQSLFIPQI
jgi:hypothetical protein